MFFDLDLPENGEWFPFFESHIDQITGDVVYDEPKMDADGKPIARVRVRSLSPFIEELVAKQKWSVEHVPNKTTRAMERVRFPAEQTPEERKKEKEDTWDYAITGLEGLKDKSTGKEIECTRENKLKLMRLPVFDRFIARCLQLLAESGVSEAEEREKNLSSG